MQGERGGGLVEAGLGWEARWGLGIMGKGWGGRLEGEER